MWFEIQIVFSKDSNSTGRRFDSAFWLKCFFSKSYFYTFSSFYFLILFRATVYCFLAYFCEAQQFGFRNGSIFAGVCVPLFDCSTKQRFSCDKIGFH